jgi:hypothetical protein
MEMTLEQLKEKVLTVKTALGWYRIGKIRNYDLYLHEISDKCLEYWGYVGDYPNRTWGKQVLKWQDLTDEELTMIEKFVILRYPKDYTVTRNSYLITFENNETKEKLCVNLKDKKFTKVYATGKERDIKYPHSFFKGMNGKLVATKIPADDNFKKLIDTIIAKEYHCSNMGTFLVRMFDNIHLETYINAGIPFSSDITVPYNFFDKDVREVLNKHNLTYDKTVESFFGNNHDLGKSMLHFIKDEPKFESIFRGIAKNMRDVNILVNDFNYDVKRLFEYCKERNWSTGTYTWRSNDLVNFICDYARMADCVFPNGFEKYPKDIKDHHDGVTKLYEKEKLKFDDQKFAKMIDTKMEYSNKEFCMVYPKSTGDIQAEGRILSHCVGSYINYVLSGQKTILFLRKKDDVETPLVTVDITDGRINQARGKFNRGLVYDEKMFLQEYAEKKKLKMIGGY